MSRGFTEDQLNAPGFDLLTALGFSREQIAQSNDYVCGTMTVEGAPFFLGEPEHNGWETPATAGTRTVRIEVFVDDPDAFIARAAAAGADATIDPVRDHQMPWGTHRQGGFLDPFGHKWLVGDRSPLTRHDPG